MGCMDSTCHGHWTARVLQCRLPKYQNTLNQQGHLRGYDLTKEARLGISWELTCWAHISRTSLALLWISRVMAKLLWFALLTNKDVGVGINNTGAGQIFKLNVAAVE